MTSIQTSIFPNRTTADFVEDLEKLTTEIQELYCLDKIPWIVGYSGGKDSTATLQLIWNAVSQIPQEKLTKKIYVITTDTLVENPIISNWVCRSLEAMKKAANEKNLPIEPRLLKPEVTQAYWVNLIGKGYPAPRHKFRWCTDRLKVAPSNRFIRNIVRSNSEAIVILGTRKTESSSRAAIMAKREAKRIRERLCPHPQLPNSLIYTPVEDWTSDEVWLYLMQWENPWGHSNKDLFVMYRGATADNECPLVIDTSTPSCGDSRFGCWVCTLVNQDKSMEAMILNDEAKEWMQPLLDIRRELDIKNDRDKRDFRRIFGKVQLFERNVDGEVSVEPIPGPYTKKWREHWLRRVLEAQTQIRQTAPEEFKEITLIQPEELSEIRRIWLEEKHEFDDSLPRIYKDVTGEEFKDLRRGIGSSLLGLDEWNTLEEICGEDAMHLELMAKLLDTERQYHVKSYRTGIFQSLEKCFESSSRSKKDAIDNARLKRDLKTAVEEKDTDKVKQLTWANIKNSADNSTEFEEEE